MDTNFGGFETFQVEVSGNTIFGRRYGSGPPILLVHGFPRTSVMWRDVAPQLATDHTVIAVDLRAYGRSGTAKSTDDHLPYSKRAMGSELVDVMAKLGPDILEQYAATLRDPVRVHGICEEYRAAVTIDVEHDEVDKAAGNKIQCPMLHLWAEGGPLDTFYANDGGSLGIWRQWAPRAQGQAVKGGHFFPEENPNDTVALIKQFLVAT
jgi:pimeloyl-ACP methyl ester carboxylesterase